MLLFLAVMHTEAHLSIYIRKSSLTNHSSHSKTNPNLSINGLNKYDKILRELQTFIMGSETHFKARITVMRSVHLALKGLNLAWK